MNSKLIVLLLLVLVAIGGYGAWELRQQRIEARAADRAEQARDEAEQRRECDGTASDGIFDQDPCNERGGIFD